MSKVVYRVHTLGDRNEIIQDKTLECAGDQDAIDQVKRMRTGHALELWSECRFLCRFPAVEVRPHDLRMGNIRTERLKPALPSPAAAEKKPHGLAVPKCPAEGPITSPLQNFVKHLSAHTVLREQAIQAICGLRGQRVTVSAGKEFVSQNTKATCVSLIIDGLAARSVVTALGSRQITAFYVSGDIPDLNSVVGAKPTSTLVAVTKAQIYRISRDELRTVSAAFPEVSEAFWRCAAWDASASTEWVVNLGARSALTRIAHLICELAVKIGEPRPERFSFALPLTQAVLADATGLSPVHVNRCLQSLRTSNLLQFDHGVITIPNWQELVVAADFDVQYIRPAAPAHAPVFAPPTNPPTNGELAMQTRLPALEGR